MPVAGGEEVTIAVGMLLPLGVLRVAVVDEDVDDDEVVVVYATDGGVEDCATDERVVNSTPVGLGVSTDELVFEIWDMTGGVPEAVDAVRLSD